MNICYSAVLLVINGLVHLFHRECNWALIGKKVALVEFYWGAATGSVFSWTHRYDTSSVPMSHVSVAHISVADHHVTYGQGHTELSHVRHGEPISKGT